MVLFCELAHTQFTVRTYFVAVLYLTITQAGC